MAASPDFENRTNQYLHMFIPKRMDEKVYDEKEGQKLWIESIRLWERIDQNAMIL
jgi:hypothetical protein